jgi:heat shock protein HslJ
MIRALIFSALLLAGCATVPPSQSPQGDWQIVSIAGQSAEGEGEVHFDPPGGAVRGRAPCNGFGGLQYTLAGARILMTGDGAMTLRACADPLRQERERIFVDVLFKSPHFRIDDDRMLLTGPSGQVVELRREPN